MATITAVIAATTAANTSVTGSLDAGEVRVFACVGLQSDKGEFVKIEKSNAAGDSYSIIQYEGMDGRPKEARLTTYLDAVSVNGPINYRINKSATQSALEVVEYS